VDSTWWTDLRNVRRRWRHVHPPKKRPPPAAERAPTLSAMTQAPPVRQPSQRVRRENPKYRHEEQPQAEELTAATTVSVPSTNVAPRHAPAPVEPQFGPLAAEAAWRLQAQRDRAASDTVPDTKKRKRNQIPPGLGHWTPDEDALLREVVLEETRSTGGTSPARDEHPGKSGANLAYRGLNWTSVSHSVPLRNSKQCRERWLTHLSPDVTKKGQWSAEEEENFLRARRLHGKTRHQPK
jgi:hypothetical protein